MANFFIKRPIFAIVVALVVSIAGLLAVFSLPVDRYPRITPPQVSVRATYPGADAEVVAQTVAEVIEKNVVGVEGFDSMNSNSNSNGSYSLTVQFAMGTDSDLATVRVQNGVTASDAGLPDTVRSIGVTTRKSSGDMALVVSFYSPNGTYDKNFLKNYFSMNYLDELKSIKGVGTVQEFGSDFAMRIWMDPSKMSQNNITAAEVIAAVSNQNKQIAAGNIGAPPVSMDQPFQYVITAKGRLVTAEEFGNIVLRTNNDGSLLRLKDVARTELDAKDYNFISRAGNYETSAVAFSLTDDANAVQTIGAIKAKLAEDAKSFPDDMKYVINMDNTDFIYASIKEVIETFVEALLLVAIIVYIFLQNWRSTLIPMIAVPVSLLGTFASFEILGFTINTLTLFAMVLAIGLVVDDAIVVIEAVEYEMRYNNLDPKAATVEAMQKVQSPVIGVAVVLAAVFVPVAFLGGIMGILYKQFALTIAVSVILSAFTALSLTPALCAGSDTVHGCRRSRALLPNASSAVISTPSLSPGIAKIFVKDRMTAIFWYSRRHGIHVLSFSFLANGRKLSSMITFVRGFAPAIFVSSCLVKLLPSGLDGFPRNTRSSPSGIFPAFASSKSISRIAIPARRIPVSYSPKHGRMSPPRAPPPAQSTSGMIRMSSAAPLPGISMSSDTSSAFAQACFSSSSSGSG